MATAGGLGLLAVALVLFPTNRTPPPATAAGRGPIPTATGVPSDQALPSAGGAATSPSLPLTTSPSPAGGADTPAVEAPLPAAPSGDYEINLTDEQISALVERRYAALFQSLRLPPGDLARFRALLVERQQTIIDAANSAVLVGVNPVRDLATVRRVIATVQADADAVLRGEMGETVFAAWRDYDRTLPERNAVTDLARVLAAAREPLRPEQAEQVMQILQAAPGVDAPADIDHLIFGGAHPRVPISEQAVAAAGRVLSPLQLELLAPFRELQQPKTTETAPQ